MLNLLKTRQLYESYTGPSRTHGGGRVAFVNQFRHWLGLGDKAGNDYRDRAGNRVLKDVQLDTGEVDLQEAAVAIIGSHYKSFFDPSNPGSLAGVARHRQLVESQHPGDGRALLESVGVGVDVSSFANVNAWTAVTGGLIERRILEAFKNPQFIADDLMPVEPTKVKEGQKVIGAARLGDKGEERQPGQPHKRAGFGERWVTIPSTRERALAVDVHKETVFFDLTGQVLEHAGQVGEWLAYNKELEVIDAFIGVTNGSSGRCAFNYKGTAYDTYTTSRTNGYLNDQTNDLLDWNAVEASWLLFQRMQDPETSTRILSMPDTVLVNPAKVATARLVIDPGEVERRGAGTSTQATAATLNITSGGNPVKEFGAKKILSSPLVEQRCTDTTGLALSQADANKYWWHFQSGKVARYYQNWPLTIAQAPANSYEMLDRGIVASYFANERGTPAIVSPWHVVRNKA
jgi:hypothetical protein